MTVGLLNAYHFDRDPNSYRAEYRPMTVSYLQKVLPRQEVRVFEVAQDEWPPSTAECDAWIITGSAKGAYDSDPWITHLNGFIRSCDQEKRKLIGICFGHQMVAQALGGRVEKSAKGWGVGVRSFKIIEQCPWMRPALSECSLLFSHQDQVVQLPRGARHLATDPFCEYQMYSIGEHIFCLQGHPEFTVEFARARVESRIDLIGKERSQEALASFSKPTQHLEVGEWFRHFIE